MQALKQAARENDSVRVDALCEAWSVSAAAGSQAEPDMPPVAAGPKNPESKKTETQATNEADSGVETHR
jgi:hypothetical protein